MQSFLPRLHSLALDICGINISCIIISDDVSYPHVALILQLCPNAKQIKFENLSVWPEVVKHIPILNDVLLEVDDKSSTCLLNLFNKSKVNALKFATSSEENGIGIRGFLRTQQHLKSIYCRGRNALELFYSYGNSYNENYQELPFRLEILVLSNVFVRNYYIDLFLPSASHLRFLSLVDITPVSTHHLLAGFIDTCTNLNELTLQNCLLPSLKPSKTITKVTLRQSTTSKWIAGMKKLKKLQIFGQMDLSDEELFDYDLHTFRELEVLEIHSSEIKNSLQIPSVQWLKLHQVTRLPTILIASDTVITQLDVSNCDECTEQILQEAALKMRKLQRISVKHGRASHATIADLKRNCRELKSFFSLHLEVLQRE